MVKAAAAKAAVVDKVAAADNKAEAVDAAAIAESSVAESSCSRRGECLRLTFLVRW